MTIDKITLTQRELMDLVFNALSHRHDGRVMSVDIVYEPLPSFPGHEPTRAFRGTFYRHPDGSSEWNLGGDRIRFESP